jgi:hypothetical protein
MPGKVCRRTGQMSQRPVAGHAAPLEGIQLVAWRLLESGGPANGKVICSCY